MKDNYGVINEQGFPAGNNLGFKPLDEAERKTIEEQLKQKEDREQNK